MDTRDKSADKKKERKKEQKKSQINAAGGFVLKIRAQKVSGGGRIHKVKA